LTGIRFIGNNEPMWRPIEEEVDALVSFRRGLTYPTLQSIRWQHRRIDFAETSRVERDRYRLTYWLTDGSSRYALRYEFPRQRWVLEGLDDSGFLDPAPDIPPPRCFPPSGW